MNERPFDRLLLWIDPLPRGGAWNMAADQALLEKCALPVLRAYHWAEPTVTIGYAQSLEKLETALPPWPVVRRWTGGGVVLHNGDATYSVIVPASVEWSRLRPVESYRLLHGSLAAALNAASHPHCRLAAAEDVIDKPFCFEAPAVHDVVRGAVKIAGAGQRRSKIGLLHQGSVQQAAVGADFWRQWAGELAATVEELPALPDDIALRADELAVTRYGTEAWLREREG